MVEVLVSHQTKHQPNGCESLYIYSFLLKLFCGVCLPERCKVYLLYAAGDLLHFLFRDRYVGWAVVREDVCVCVCVCGGGGNELSSNSVCLSNSLNSNDVFRDTL